MNRWGRGRRIFPMPPSPDSSTLLTRQTGVTIGLGVMILGAAVSAAWWFGKWTGADYAWKAEMDRRLSGIEESVRVVEEQGTSHRWTSIDMTRWAARLREQNTTLTVPEPYSATPQGR